MLIRCDVGIGPRAFRADMELRSSLVSANGACSWTPERFATVASPPHFYPEVEVVLTLAETLEFYRWIRSLLADSRYRAALNAAARQLDEAAAKSPAANFDGN